MITKTEIIGNCPIGQLIRETKVDRFGFWAGERIYKLVRKDWLGERIFEDYQEKGLTYSDKKYYYPQEELTEAFE